MKLRKFGFAISLCLLVSTSLLAQRRRSSEDFLRSQFWIGPTFSITQSTFRTDSLRSSVTFVDDQIDPLRTEFDVDETIYGGSFGLTLGYSYRIFTLFFDPAIGIRNYRYRQQYNWTGDEELLVDLTYKQQLQQVELPVRLQIDLLPTRFTPYLFGQLQWNRPFATSLEVDEERGTLSPTNPRFQRIDDNRDEFDTWSSEWHAGAGLSYHVGNVLLFAQVSIGRSFNPITQPQQNAVEYANLSAGYANNALETETYQLSFGTRLPFRYLTNFYRSKS